MLIRVRAQRAQFNNDPLSAATYVSEREGVGRPALSKGIEGERAEDRGARGPAGRSGQRRATGRSGVARLAIPNDWIEMGEALARVPAAP
jgi:hypothetical protein